MIPTEEQAAIIFAAFVLFVILLAYWQDIKETIQEMRFWIRYWLKNRRK